MSTMKPTRLAMALVIIVCLATCMTTRQPSIRDVLASMPTKNLRSYSFDPTTKLEDRVMAAPDFLLEYARSIDKTDAYTAYMPTADEQAQLSSYLALLPDDYRETLQERLIGIYFIDNWIGSGMADYVLGDDDKLYAILIINPETMRHDISEWVSYRESTAFQTQGPEFRIRVDCGTEYTGLLYLLLHETAHIMDYVHRYTPYVEPDMRSLGMYSDDSAFTRDIWLGYDQAVPAFDYADRSAISFYGLGGRPLIPLVEALLLYEALQNTPFVSLYGSRNWAEDYAEYSTWSYYTSVLHQPYRIVIARTGQPDMVIEPMKLERIRTRTVPVAQR